MGRSRMNGLLAALFAVLAAGAALTAEPGGDKAALRWALVGVLGVAALVAAAEAWRWSAPPGRHRAELAPQSGAATEQRSTLLALEGSNVVPPAAALLADSTGGAHRASAQQVERQVLPAGTDLTG